jgi:hypothetical protein
MISWDPENGPFQNKTLIIIDDKIYRLLRVSKNFLDYLQKYEKTAH